MLGGTVGKICNLSDIIGASSTHFNKDLKIKHAHLLLTDPWIAQITFLKLINLLVFLPLSLSYLELCINSDSRQMHSFALVVG